MPRQENEGACVCEDISYLGTRKCGSTLLILPCDTLRVPDYFSVTKRDRIVANVEGLTENVQDTGTSRIRCFAMKLAKL